MTTHERLDAIERRCDAATPGPWEYDGEHDEITAGGGYVFSWIGVPLGASDSDRFGHRFVPNFDFMAHARTDLPALLRLTRALLAEREADASLGVSPARRQEYIAASEAAEAAIREFERGDA